MTPKLPSTDPRYCRQPYLRVLRPWKSARDWPSGCPIPTMSDQRGADTMKVVPAFENLYRSGNKTFKAIFVALALSIAICCFYIIMEVYVNPLRASTPRCSLTAAAQVLDMSNRSQISAISHSNTGSGSCTATWSLPISSRLHQYAIGSFDDWPHDTLLQVEYLEDSEVKDSDSSIHSNGRLFYTTQATCCPSAHAAEPPASVHTARS